MTSAQRQGIVMARGLTSLCRIAVGELAFISYKYSIQETPLFLVISHEWIPFSGSLNISGTEYFQSPYTSVDREGCVISELESERLSPSWIGEVIPTVDGLICNDTVFVLVNVTRVPSVWTGLLSVDICLTPPDPSVFPPPLPLCLHLLSLFLSPISWCAAERHNYPLHLSRRDNGWPSPLGK